MSDAAMVEKPDAPIGIALGELVKLLARVEARVKGDASVRVSSLCQDSRRVRRGELFAARPGISENGATFVRDAVQRGAAAILVEKGALLPELGVPVVEVHDPRLALALAAEALQGFPSASVRVVGITGTNGKTTTSWLAQQAINGAGGRAARLGTLGFSFQAECVDSSLTTPEADEISRYVARVRERGGSELVMEVSSHALAQARVDAIRFAVAAFTNLTQDHLDYHGSMDEYARAKRRLFEELEPSASAVNVDDPLGREIARFAHRRLLRVSRVAEADVFPRRVEHDARGIRGEIVLPSGAVELQSRLVGEHNLDNLLMALAISEALGFAAARAAIALGQAAAVPGRLERCDVPRDDVIVLVDYAHTPDALRRALAAVRALGRGRVICVFGCGGDRDPEKRAIMGEVVAAGADRAMVTNDNPRSEAPEAIARAIELGLRAGAASHEIELDRSLAIERAVLEASPGDVVLIAGKGHESYQIIGAERRRFDDRFEARRALALRREKLEA